MSFSFDPKPVKLTKKTQEKAPAQEEEEDTPKKVGPEIGKKIVQARSAAQMKQKDLAMKTSLSLHVISDWESGNALFDKGIARKIKKVLKIDF